jgi:nitroimidazol reductase NimA-like FMN-containing flavoprotein (pyridoxamine 5'-phosphate oxidase superfamily)
MWIDAKGSTVLPGPECKRLLAVAAKDARIGRLGIATDGAPLVIPVNFTLHDGQVVARVGTGTLSGAAAGHLVAFEVDHVDGETGTAWSVLVRGLATLIESPSKTQLAMTRSLVPKPGEMLLVVRPDIVTGRRFEVRRSGHRARSDPAMPSKPSGSGRSRTAS